MADQMTPAELRAAADEMDEWVNPNNAFDICRDATRRLADVIEHAEHGDGYQGFLSRDKVLSLARGDTINHENRSG